MSSRSQLKKDYFWNTLASVTNAASSVLLLIVVTQVLGAYIGGIYSLAFAVAQQFQTLGQYEMRPYQATDVKQTYPFGIYFASRIVTCSMMILGIIGYAIYSNGFSYDTLLIILLGFLRFFDAFEDVFHGMFQQRGRLDIASKAFFGRLVVTMFSFAGSILIFKDILVACIVSILISTIAFLLLNIPVAQTFEKLKPIFGIKKLKGLLITCFPLFLGSFFLMYLVNAPRYGIEALLCKEDQTYYAILFMPAMLINLLSGFIFKPLLTTLADRWHLDSKRGFISILAKGLLSVAIMSILVSAIAYPIGIPFLTFIYGVDLTGFRPILMGLMIGGMFNAASVILYYGIVSSRHQGVILPGYGIGALVALLFTNPLINHFGMMGAVILYDSTMALLTFIFGACNLFFITKSKLSKRSSN